MLPEAGFFVHAVRQNHVMYVVAYVTYDVCTIQSHSACLASIKHQVTGQGRAIAPHTHLL